MWRELNKPGESSTNTNNQIQEKSRAQIRTEDARIRIWSANHYTTQPPVEAVFFSFDSLRTFNEKDG